MFLDFVMFIGSVMFMDLVVCLGFVMVPGLVTLKNGLPQLLDGRLHALVTFIFSSSDQQLEVLRCFLAFVIV